MGRKGSEMSPSKRYPLRSTHNSGRFLLSATNKSNTTSSEPLNDSAPAQPSLRKRKSGSSSGSPSNTVRVLRSASKNKVDLCSKSLNDSTPGELDANKRKGIRPSKATSPISSVRVLRCASKNKDEVCSETLKSSTAGEQVANERKLVTRSKVESPNNSVRVLRSASKNKNEAYSEPLNDNTIAQPSAKKRKSGSPLKVGSPASSARVLRSNSKRANETFNVPQHDIPATQQASRKGKSDTAPKGGSLKPVGRVLRSASEKKDEPLRAGFVLALPSTHHGKQQRLNVSRPVQPVMKRIKSGGSSKECSHKKEDYLKIRQRVRYVLNRMNYEQSLIQAYAGEGWKGQSLEKIRPEKELERAKAEILRCKIKIREAFQNMDSLLSEGKLEESLFDSAGQIFSEDIFCSICGSKDVTSKNDIILCDGACDRGFHQNCLSPPLRTEDIPPGNEGWFCPACVCKIDCIDALNELQGSKLSVHDSWERVFPEAASLANGSKQHDASDRPLDDSEDNCYNPGLDKVHIVKGGRSSADNDGNVDGFPSDDSEDDDFDPAGPDSSEHQKAESHSSESDFTSDSDDFCAEIAKSRGQGGVSPLSNVNEEFQNRLFMETELDQDVVLPVCSRRQVERLDYKKLYDEAYGEESSSSSDDEEWSGKEKLEDSDTDGSVRPAKRHSRRASIENPNSQYTQSERQYGSVSEQQAEIHRSNGSNGSARHFAPTVRQKLKDHFENDPYPSRATKESLARELGLTFIQVDKWFASTRHSSRIAAAKKGKLTENHTTGNDGTAVESTEVNDEVLVELTADRNGMTHEEMMVQNNPNEGNKKDILLSRAETKTDAYTTEVSSDDKEWSGTSISQKELEDTQMDSHAASNHAKRLTRRALVEPHNNKHTPLSEQLHVSVNDQQTEAPYFNGSSSKARKNRFGPVVSQKLKGHFEKDPYPNRSTIQNLAQELGLTSIQVRKWFSSTRHYSSVSAAKKGKGPQTRSIVLHGKGPHYSSVSAAKKGKGPGSHTNEKNDSTTLDSKREKKSDNGAMENLTKDRNDSLSRKLMLQINLNEGNNDDIDNMFSQHPSCEEALVTTPTAISIEVGPPGYMPGENQGKGAVWSTGFEQGLTTTPTPVSSEVGPQGYGYGTGVNQGYSGSWNIISDSEHGILMTPTVTTMPIPREVGATGYGPGESQGNNASWNTSSEHRLFMTPSTSSREACPPGYGPGEGQVNSASWNTCSDQLVDVAPSTISRQVCQPGYGPRENQVSGASWNTSTGQRLVMTPSTIPREVDPPGYWPGKNQGNSASWNNRRDQSFFMTPTTTLSEVGPPGYGPGENKGNGASTNVGSPNDRPSEKQELADEARKKAIARELRRMKKFR